MQPLASFQPLAGTADFENCQFDVRAELMVGDGGDQSDSSRLLPIGHMYSMTRTGMWT